MSGTALQLLYLRRPSKPWEAKYGETYVTYLFYANHFVALKIDCLRFTVVVANSMNQYCEAELMGKINVLVKWLEKAIVGANFSVAFKWKARQQESGSNDCGIITAENCLSWMFPGANVTVNRETFVNILETDA